MSSHTLTLMRHAKSSWKTQGQIDHDRPLNARGHRDAPDMAQRLKARGSIPDLIITSSAKRALTTAEYVKNTLGAADSDMEIEPSLYLASPQKIVSLLRSLDARVEHVLVVAHNPGLEDLSAMLASDSPTHFPTAAIRQFSCPQWSQLAINRRADQPSIELIHSDYPKNILA